MKILHVYKDFYPVVGGIENHLKLLTGELSRLADTEVEVLVTNTGPRTVVERFYGVRVTKAARLATIASTPISLALLREVGRRHYDIIHLHFPYPVGEMASLWRGRARRLVITYHSDVVRQRLILRFYHPFLLRLLARTDAIIATSPKYIETSPYLSRFKEKCTVVPFGIDVAFFQNQVNPSVEAQLKAAYKPPFLLFVGKFRYYKGLHYLIEAMRQIPKGALLLVGSGPEEASLRAQVKSLGLEARVAFLGEVEEHLLPSFYHASQVFVLPACQRAEAFGIVQLEAMACGLPVVSTEVGTGTSYVNQHEVTGLVVPPADPDALADAINKLLADEALRQAMGRAARVRAEAEFTKERMVERVRALYEQIL
ncbi:MAG: glycosyltransferase [Dehalococcoidia bacterium]|nr:glycosyltransferase [Dehalococcoidia bacterium]